MESDWERAINFVLKEEGGYTLDPNDRGGETNFGISSRRYPKVDIKNLTREGAIQLYRKDFWDFCHCSELPSPLAIAVFDAAVNQGERGAIRMLQIALGFASESVDGVFGDKTSAAAFKAGPDTTRRFMAQRMARYIRTTLQTPTDEVYAENWSSRLMRLAELVFARETVA